MPKLIDYPRTTYAGAWELAEVTDDTGGKCAIETAARKMDRKVSGSFKAIIGSAVKFGLLTSKRDLLTTTTLFKRIKHAYDKQEEVVFHREAFLTPPLFTQICRKFRSRELPIQMLDVMLIREFGVEEINAQGVAKAFVEGARMVGLLDEHNTIADIDSLANTRTQRREIATPVPTSNSFRQEANNLNVNAEPLKNIKDENYFETLPKQKEPNPLHETKPVRSAATIPTAGKEGDAIASLFGLIESPIERQAEKLTQLNERPAIAATGLPLEPAVQEATPVKPMPPTQSSSGYQVQISGIGINTTLSITEEEDIALAVALLEKIRRQLKG